MTTCEIWVMVDENGEYTVAKEAGDLEQPEAGVATRILKVTVNVPTPEAVELEATIDPEPQTGELKVA